MKLTRRTTSLTSIILLALLLSGLSGCGKSVEPMQLSTQWWRGHFIKHNFLTFIDVQLVQNGSEITGEYSFSAYSSHRFNGKLTGKVEGEAVVLELEVPESAASIYKNLNMKLTLAECSPQEAQDARNFIRSQPGHPEEMMTRQLKKLYGTLNYDFNGNPESQNGMVAESVEETKKTDS